MIRSTKRDVDSVVVAQADIVSALVSLYVACSIRDGILTRISTLWAGETDLLPQYPLLLLGTLPVLVGSLYLFGAYRIDNAAWVPRRLIATIGRAFVLSALVVMALAFLFRDQVFSRAIIVGYLVLSHLGFLMIRWAVTVLRRERGQRVGPPRSLVVGTGPAARSIALALQRNRDLGHTLVGFVDVPFERDRDESVPTLGAVEHLPRLKDELVVDTVVFGTSLEESARLEEIVWKLEEVGTTVHLRGDALGAVLSRTMVGELDGIPMLTISSVPTEPFALRAKRAIDLLGALVGLVLLSPLLVAAALAVKLTSPGPVLHRQERVGLNGRRFQMLKFRSMHVDAEERKADLLASNEMSGPVFKMRDDPRVTGIGAALRRYSIDELPQLWNVLAGDMSLVGPRPPLAEEVTRYERWQRRRLSMKPGLTCLWQVNGRNDVDFNTWMRFDMEYIDNWSLGLDIRILLKTIPVVLMARGAR